MPDSFLYQILTILAQFQTVVLKTGTSAVFQIVLSAFCGGLFAGLFANYFETTRRIKDKRYDKYYEHRSTIVQIEHELIPARLNISKNITTLDVALKGSDDVKIRLILRLYKLRLSTSLSLRLLNLGLVNDYADIYILFETINSDIEYINSMVEQIKQGPGASPGTFISLLNSYILMAPYLKEKCEEADKKSIELLAKCRIALHRDDETIRNNYISVGKQVEYGFKKSDLVKDYSRIRKTESEGQENGKNRPKFIAPYMDVSLKTIA